MTLRHSKEVLPDDLFDLLPEKTEVPFGGAVTDFLSSMDEVRTHSLKVKTPTVFCLTESQLGRLISDFEQPTPNPEEDIADGRLYSRYELLQLILAHAIGFPMSNTDIRGGLVIQDIIPVDSKIDVADSSHGSAKEFSFHNDMSFLEEPQIPDYFSLACVRNVEKASTTLADPHVALLEAGGSVAAELKKPQYVFRHTYNRKCHDQYTTERVGPVITENGEVRLGVDMEGLTPSANAALDDFVKALGSTCVAHVLERGQILVMPNRVFVHGRQPFTMATNPPERRWIQRVNITSHHSSGMKPLFLSR